MSIEIDRCFKRDRDIGRKAVLGDFKTAFTCTLAELIVCGPLQFNSHLLMYFRAVFLSDPIRCVLKHGTGHAVKCLNV